MSDEIDLIPEVSELDALKQRADMMGVKYHPSISLEKLRDKVAAAMQPAEEQAPAAEVAAPAPVNPRLVAQQLAAELVRIRVTCMNPAKKDWEGEIFTVGNSVVGTFKKYVPFNNDEGWHVPRIILEQIQQRECQVFVTVKDSRGNSTRRGKLIKEFGVEILDPLTEEELKDLAQRQAMAKSID